MYLKERYIAPLERQGIPVVAGIGGHWTPREDIVHATEAVLLGVPMSAYRERYLLKHTFPIALSSS